METCLAQNSATTTLNQTPLHIQKLLDTKPCPVKFPTFAGLANEDFVIFRDRFTTAAQARGISRIDQVDKLRDMLTGKALAYLPKEGIGDIDVAWEYLSQVYGNSHTILNFHLAKLVGMPGMTDEIMETNPQDAADWFLDMEILVDSILRVGVRSQELQWLTFSRETMFHCIISKLPYRLLDRTYELDTQGEEKLRQVLQLIRRARANAQARATDITTDKILSSTDMTLPPSSRSPETGHMMGTSSLPARATTTSTSSLPPSFYQSSSDTYLSPTPLPCITDTEIPSLFSTPYTPQGEDIVLPSSYEVFLSPEDSPTSTDIDIWALAAAAPAKRAAAEADARKAVAEADAISAKKAADEKAVALCSLSTKFGEDHLAIESILSAFHTEFLENPNLETLTSDPQELRKVDFHMLNMYDTVGKLSRTHSDEQADLIKAMNSLIDHLRFRHVDCYRIIDSIIEQADVASTSITDVEETLETTACVSGSETATSDKPTSLPTTTFSHSSFSQPVGATLSHPSSYHLPLVVYYTLILHVVLYEDPCSVYRLCVLSHRIFMGTPTTAEIQSPSTLTLYFIVSQSVYYSEESTSMPPKPPWTLHNCSTVSMDASELSSLSSNPAIRVSTVNETADMLTSQLSTFTVIHRLIPIGCWALPSSALFSLYIWISWFLLCRSVICQETTAFLPPKPPWLMADKSPCTFLMICPDTRELSTATVLLSTVLLSMVLLSRVVVSRVMMSTVLLSSYCHILLSSLYQSTTLNTPMMNCLTTSPVVMPSWTIQTSSVTYDMLASSAILFSLICTLGFLSPSLVQSPVEPPTTICITMLTPTENFFLANSGSLDTPSVAVALLRSSSVSISSLHITPRPKKEESQCIQLESDFLHLLLFSSVEQGLAVGMTDLSTPPFTSVLCPTYVAAPLLIQWDPGLLHNFAAATVYRL